MMTTTQNFKITDIFGYLSADEISLEEIEEIFYQSVEENVSEEYKIFFNSNQIELSHFQKGAEADLRALHRKVAYMTRNSEVVAVIGYRVIESESTMENRK